MMLSYNLTLDIFKRKLRFWGKGSLYSFSQRTVNKLLSQNFNFYLFNSKVSRFFLYLHS